MKLISQLSYNFKKLSELLSLDDILKQLSDNRLFTKRLKICQDNFKRLNAGSSRIIFELPNNLVLKLAKNQKGILQNNMEDDEFLHQSWIVNSPIKADSNHYWIIVPHAQKISKEDFNRLTGMNWENYCDYLKAWKNNNLSSIKLNSEYQNNEYFLEIQDLVGSAGLATGDLCRLSSWGIINGKLQLIDAGLTHDIYTEYYKK
jgi:hypothetical protein